MTGVLVFYSMTFMRWSIAITPRNPLLFLCHLANASAQVIQLGRWAIAPPLLVPSASKDGGDDDDVRK